MSLVELLQIMCVRWRIILAGLLVGVCVAWGVTAASPAVYESSVTLLVNGQATLTEGSQADARNGLSQDLVATYAELVRSRPVAEAVVQRLGLPTTAAELQERLRANAVTGTSLFTVYARAGSAVEAQRVAGAVAEEFVRQASVLLTPRSGPAPVRLDVVEQASLPGAPVEPRPLRNMCVGGLLGVLVGVAGALVRNHTDRRLRGVEGLEHSSGVAILTVVPRMRRRLGLVGPNLSVIGGAHDGFERPDRAPVVEAYRRLRTRLYAPGAAAPQVLVVTSPAAGDGRTTTACYLAVALARAGHRVVLVDGDLRGPGVARMMGVAGRTGLVDVLAGTSTRARAVQSWAPGSGLLDVLVAGDATAGSSEFLAGQRLAEVVGELRRCYEFVVVDSPPTTLSTDAEILATAADGVLLVARYARTPQVRVQEVVHNLALVNAPITGAVFTMVPLRAGWGVRAPSAVAVAQPVARPMTTAGPPALAGPQTGKRDGDATRARGVARVPARPPAELTGDQVRVWEVAPTAVEAGWHPGGFGGDQVRVRVWEVDGLPVVPPHAAAAEARAALMSAAAQPPTTPEPPPPATASEDPDTEQRDDHGAG